MADEAPSGGSKHPDGPVLAGDAKEHAGNGAAGDVPIPTDEAQDNDGICGCLDEAPDAGEKATVSFFVLIFVSCGLSQTNAVVTYALWRQIDAD